MTKSLTKSDQADQGGEEQSHPADCLAVDDVQGVLRYVELNRGECR